MIFLDEAFEQLMILLPLWLPIVVIGFAVQWVLVRSAVLAALRAHTRDSSLDGS